MNTQQSTGQTEPDWVQTIRSWNLTRSDDRWFTGVAGGIAKRMQIDPLIIRGAIIVITLLSFGVGVITYLLGWLFLPDDRDGRIAAQDMSFDSRRRNQYIGVILLVAGTLALMGIVGVSFGLIAGPLVGFLVLAGVGLYFLFRSPGSEGSSPSDDDGAPRTPPADSAQTAWDSSAMTSASSDSSTSTAIIPAPSAPHAEWSTSSAQAVPSPHAPGSDSGPATAVYAPNRPRVQSIGGTGFLVTAGLSLLLLAGLLIAQTQDAFHLAVAPVWLMGSLVLAGLVIVVGGLMGRTSGAVGFFAILGVLAAPFVAVFGSGPVMHPDADIVWFGGSTQVISEPTDVGDGYGVIAGNLTVDIGDLDTSDADLPITIPLGAVAGELTVIVGTQDVGVNYSVQAGTIESFVPGLNLDASGIRIADGRAGFPSDGSDPDIILDLRLTAGSINLEVSR